MMPFRSGALPVPIRVTALCTLVLVLHAGASGTVCAAAPRPLDGLRLFLTPEQRIRERANDSQAPSTSTSTSTSSTIGPDPVVVPSAGAAGTIDAARARTALGRATVRGRRGVQRIEHGVPHRGVYP